MYTLDALYRFACYVYFVNSNFALMHKYLQSFYNKDI